MKTFEEIKEELETLQRQYTKEQFLDFVAIYFTLHQGQEAVSLERYQ